MRIDIGIQLYLKYSRRTSAFRAKALRRRRRILRFPTKTLLPDELRAFSQTSNFSSYFSGSWIPISIRSFLYYWSVCSTYPSKFRIYSELFMSLWYFLCFYLHSHFFLFTLCKSVQNTNANDRRLVDEISKSELKSLKVKVKLRSAKWIIYDVWGYVIVR